MLTQKGIGKHLPIIMITFACLAMMYGRVFVKPEQYHHVPNKGFLTQSEYKSYLRSIDARILADEFLDTQLNLWYSIANDDIAIGDINQMLGDDIYELENFRKSTDDSNTHTVDSITRVSTGGYNIRRTEPVVRL